MQAMEYLTLQDIPQRHCNPVHSHRMASQSSERPVGHMAAVRDIFSFDSAPTSTASRLFLPPHQPRVSYAYASRSRRKVAQARHLPEELREIALPEPLLVSPPTPPDPSGDVFFRNLLESEMDCDRLDKTLAATLPCRDVVVLNKYFEWCNTKTASQNHLQRSSPPLQPGEQNFPGKLPSFDEVSTV